MADLTLTRIQGFTFNSTTVDNSLNDDIVLIDVERDASSNLLYYDFVVPMRDGSRRKDNRREDKLINIIIGIYASTVQERRQKERLFLQNIIGKEGKLSFKDDPTLFYFAKNYGPITRDEDVIYTQITIPFICSYCMYEFCNDLRDYTVEQLAYLTINDLEGILVNRQLWDNITASTTRPITNYGNFETNPTIYLNGTATNIQIQIADVAFSFANLSAEEVIIDSEEMIVYKVVGGQKESVLTRFTGNFPTIPIGETDVVITGTNLNLSITVDYKNTYIV